MYDEPWPAKTVYFGSNVIQDYGSYEYDYGYSTAEYFETIPQQDFGGTMGEAQQAEEVQDEAQ